MLVYTTQLFLVYFLYATCMFLEKIPLPFINTKQQTIFFTSNSFDKINRKGVESVETMALLKCPKNERKRFIVTKTKLVHICFVGFCCHFGCIVIVTGIHFTSCIFHLSPAVYNYRLAHISRMVNFIVLFACLHAGPPQLNL